MLEIRGLSKQYPGRKEQALYAVDLQIDEGEFVVILGRSGAGKSTLIRCINRLVEPDEGEIRWKGQAITGIANRPLRKLRSHIGMVFQHFNLLPRLSVSTNVISGKLSAMPWWRSLMFIFTPDERQRAMEALREVGLEEFAHKRVEELSGGQKQRVALARVMMQNPELLLGDEPVSNLDPVTAANILDRIAWLHREKRWTVVLNLHDLAAAKHYAGRIIGLAGGRVVFDGPPQSLTDVQVARIYPSDD